MNTAKLEPALRTLLAAEADEIAAEVALGRMALEIVDGVPRVTVIVTHDGLPPIDGVEVLSSRGDIATLRLDLDGLDALSEHPEVVYINASRSAKPVLHRTRAQIGAAIVDGLSIRLPAEPWNGTGTTVGVIDSGFDVRHPALRQFPGGPTRVHLYWDRSIAPADRRAGDQAGLNNIGVLYDRARIDAYLLGPPANPPVLHPNSLGLDEHGTHVAGIAAGSAPPYRGVAHGATLILVRTGTGDLGQLADICEWIFVNAVGPCSINVSLGNNSGPHDGTSVAERALDDLLRSPATLTPFEGRLISVAAGNEARKGWHVKAKVLGTDSPVTPVLWDSPGANPGQDQIVFAYPGIDRIRLRLRAPGGVRTNFVTPDPGNGNQSIDEAVPGGLAPTVAGAQAEKIFNFADGTSARIAHVEDQINGDREIEVHFRPPAGPAPQFITDGVWQLEFQGTGTELPGGGIIHGYLRDDVPDVEMDSDFVRPAVASRTLRVSPGTMLEQDLFVPNTATAEVIAVLDYPGDRELEFQLRPPLHLTTAGANPTQWVRHGAPDPVAIADATLTAPGAANAQHRLPFALGAQQVEIGHATSGSRRQITLRLVGAPPAAGFYRLRLRAVSGERPIEVEARLQQETSGRFELAIFRDDPLARVDLPVFPAASIESALRLRANGVQERVAVRLTVPGGGFAEARVRFAPSNGALATGAHPFTPWVAPGNVETAVPGSMPVAGGAAGTRIYNDGTDARVEIAYPAPAAGVDGVIDVTILNPTVPVASVRGGEWRIELRGRDDRTHRVRCELRQLNDNVDDFGLAQLLPVEQDQLEVDLLRTPGGPTAIPFVIDRDIGDELRLELLYDAASTARIRVLPAEPDRLRFAVDTGNRVVADVGAPAPAAGAGGVTGTLPGGTVVVIDHPEAPVFPGKRRALITIRSPAGRVVFPRRGVWRLEAELLTGAGSPLSTVRLATGGRPATFLTFAPANDDFQQGSLSVPGCAREIMSVANCHPSPSSVTLPADSSSPGPVRYATRMRIGGASRQWQPYAKPEVSAPGTDIAAALSSVAGPWLNFRTPADWAQITLPDGRTLEMRESWPLLEGDQIRVVHNVPPAAAAGVVTPTVWEVEFPDFAFQATLRVRYPAGSPFAVRVEQPGAVAGLAAPAAPTRTHAVAPNGAEINVALPDVTPAGTVALPHPDGPGRTYTMGDGGRVTIRQNGAGLATVEFGGTIHAGRWRLIVQHDQVLPAAVPVAVETDPSGDAQGWPKLVGQNPRSTISIGRATAAAAGEVNFRFNVPLGFMPTVTVDLTYPAPPAGPGAYSFELLVVSPAGHTHAVDTNSVVRPIIGGAAPSGPAVPTGAGFNIAHGPSGANRVVITHTPGRARVVISRGTSTAFSWANGDWDIRFLNRSLTAPAAPVAITGEIQIGPHDAPFFLLPTDFLPVASSRFGHLATGVAQEWRFRVPPRRRLPLALTVIYDARDVVELQIQDPGGARTEAVGLGDAPNAGAHGATLANTGVGAAGVEFLAAGSFRVVISHRAQPLSNGTRNELKVTLHSVDDAPLPHGDWIIHLRPGAVHAASNGVVEAWIDELLFRTLTGTSMASPHVAGLAALLFQQDHTRSHADIKRLLISTARPLLISRGGSLQLPNQWDPTAGWGMVDGAAALLGHAGGPLHNRGGTPGALGKTTGCPVACDDNCLLEAVRTNGSLVSLRPTRDAPYNRAPAAPGAPSLATCQRQAGYMAERAGAAFVGGGTFQTISSRRVDRPLVRDREHRGGLEGFEAVSWEDAYEAVVDRFVDQWTENGGMLLIEPRPRLGLVRELIFNLFSHQLHRLLGASTTVTKCSFTIKKTVSVATPRVPFGATAGGAADHGLREIWNGSAPRLLGRGEISLARHVVLWGANLPGTASDLWTTLQAMHGARGGSQMLFAVDPGLQALPSFVRRVAILPGSDRDLALALMLRIVGNPGHADAARQIPEHPRFADPTRGLRPLLDPLAPSLGDFITHVRSAAATYLRLDGGRVVPDAALLERCLGAAPGAAEIARFSDDFDRLFEAYLGGPTATILGDGPARHVDGEENIQYVAALSFVSGNMGVAGGGVGYAEDREATFNPSTFSGSHNTMRPETDRELGSEQDREAINLASLGTDAPSNSKIGLWFDLDPLTALPDASAVEGVLRRLQLSIQATGRLDDSSRFADIILPLGDSLVSYDLQLGARSPWINLTQPVEAPSAEGPRPLARVLHELFAALHAKLKDDFEDDLEPVINQDIMKRGPLLLSPTRRRELAQFFADANRIPNLLRDRLPADEVANIHTQLRNWYEAVHGGQPTTDTDAEIAFTDPVKFFNRMQVDWIIEVLLDRYAERDAVLVLYNLLQRGTALDPLRFSGDGFSTHADGDTAFAENLARASQFADLKGAAGFAPERPPYRDGVRAVDTGATGRAAYPMRLVMADPPEFSSGSIPLSAQVEGGRVKLPIVVVNPTSPSLAGRFGGPLADGAEVAVVGNVSYTAGQRFETVIAKAQVRTDATMARETLWMNPGWHGLDRGGQRVARGIHTEEGESPALFDNLVRLEPANYTPTGNAADRGTPPPKR